MILNYSETHDGEVVIVIAFSAADLLLIAADHADLPITERVPEAAAKIPGGLRLLLCGPAGAEIMLKAAVEMRDGGANVRFRGRPGIPDE